MLSRREALRRMLGGAAAACVALPGCSSHVDPWEKEPGPPRVVVSIPPLYSFVKQVGGDRVGALCLCTREGPHHHEYSSKDALALRQANLLLAIGLGLDDAFTQKLQANSGNAHLKLVKFGDNFVAEDKDKPERERRVLPFLEEHGKDKGHDQDEHGEYDPHLWLGIERAKDLVRATADELARVDEGHRDQYTANADQYGKKLDGLRTEYEERLDKLKAKKGLKELKILPTHDALQYFGKSFGLTIESPIEEKPGSNPDQHRFEELVQKCEAEKIRYIAMEPQYEEKAAKALEAELKKRKLDVELITIDPLETADPKELNADWYEQKMRQNLDELVKKLK